MLIKVQHELEEGGVYRNKIGTISARIRLLTDDHIYFDYESPEGPRYTRTSPSEFKELFPVFSYSYTTRPLGICSCRENKYVD